MQAMAEMFQHYWSNERKERFRANRAIDKLPERDQIVLRGRQQGMTLEAIGILLNLSRERVRQIEKRANQKLGLVDRNRGSA